MRNKDIDIITLGCSKNLVDSERLMGMLKAAGFNPKHDPTTPKAKIAVINTCGFIGDAKEESVNMILDFVQAKQDGKLSKLYVMGCLSQRYRDELQQEIPEVDKFYGKFDWMGLLQDLGSSERKELYGERLLTTPKHYAYLKISEGCDRHCSYCAIPIITGTHHSRPMEDILSEVGNLVAQGVKEFQIIAQELTYYGIDLYNKQMIAELIDKIAQVPGVEWIRLHYAYPSHFPFELLTVMRNHPNVCRYLDIALQHISDHMLDLMHRHVTKAETYQLIETLRKEVPGIHIRTTLMVGHPGETEEDFEELKQFVRDMKFDRMGAFAYSEEDGTFSAEHYQDDVPGSVKQKRLDKLMALQQDISAELQEKAIGSIQTVVCDRKEGDYYICRSEYSSPEVDPEILVPCHEKRLRAGAFYTVKIVDSEEFDLYATTII